MDQTTQISERIGKRVRARNRQLLLDAALAAAMGVLFTLLTFGVLFCVMYWLVLALGLRVGLGAGQTAGLLTALVFVVCVVSAWRSVDPFAALRPMSDGELLAMTISRAMPDVVYMNRHTVAGIATLLMGGPNNLATAVGMWCHRLSEDGGLHVRAAKVLSACEPESDVTKQRDLHAALLLRRLGLIIPRADTNRIAITEKGRSVLETKKR